MCFGCGLALIFWRSRFCIPCRCCRSHRLDEVLRHGLYAPVVAFALGFLRQTPADRGLWPAHVWASAIAFRRHSLDRILDLAMFAERVEQVLRLAPLDPEFESESERVAGFGVL